MNKSRFALLALAAITALTGVQLRADNMVSIAITPATGVVTLSPQWGIAGNLAGFHHMSQDLGLTGSVANNFYSIRGGLIPAGGDVLAFNFYTAASGASSPHNDIGSKLTPSSYSALTSADPDVGFGSVNFYLIHHKGTTDYFSVIKPGSAVASAVTDLKPMSAPGGPDTVTGVSGYFGLTFSASNLGYGLNQFYYLRTDPVTSNTKFGSLDPALAGIAADQFDLGIGGHNALAFTGTDVGYGTDKMYFLRLDPITGFTILGTLHPTTGKASDIANLGSVFTTLTYSPTDLGFGVNRFYSTGSVNPTWQSVSFAAIADRAISTGSFTVSPSASSGLPIVLTVVPGSTGAASISGPVGGVFTVTPTAPGVITLQAAQAGVAGDKEYNMLRQSFTATGVATLAITTQPTSQSAVTGSTANLTVTASGTSALSYQWRKAGVNVTGNATATTNSLALANVQAGDAATYDVVVTNASGSIVSNPVTLTVTTAAPVITNSPLTAAGTVGTAFSFTITATNSPTGYTATPLPTGLSINAGTGVISGNPTTAGTTAVLLGATNGTGTGNATLTITVAAAGVAPIITNSPLTAAGTVGTAFSLAIAASGSPTSYTATPLPAGLAINSTTGVITGTPTTVATTAVLLGATNSTGTGNATMTITVGAAGVAPVITNSPLTAAGTVGTPFSFAMTASGSPTSFTASPLPAGLVINATTGVITGTPTTAATTAVLLGATNAFGTGNATLTITVGAAGVAPIVTNSPLTAAGTVGTPFGFTITASGSPTTYTATPLPAGLSIVAATGAITGTPTAAGTTAVLLGATNASGTGNATLTITVAATGVAPTITNSPLTAAGTIGTPFSFAITATGSPTSYSSGALPAGLVLNRTTGVITGIPTTQANSIVVLRATNAFGTGTATLTITTVAAASAPVITNNPLTAGGTFGAPFAFSITASGSPTSYSASPLPAGLTIVAATGAITGSPVELGTTEVLLTARNATGADTAILTLTIAESTTAPFITSPAIAHGTVGVPFVTYQITGTGMPESFTATGIPAGLTFDFLTGAINGTPTVAGTSNVVITARNSAGVGSAKLTITIAPPGVAPIITSPATAKGIERQPFVTYFVSGTGLPTSFSATGLPAGLSINALTGAINGTPTTAGSYVVTVTATNSVGTTTSNLTILVATSNYSRIVNFSARAMSGPGSQTLIMGFVVTGDNKRLLVRGIGPTLANYGVVGALADPLLTLYNATGAVATNDDWQSTNGTVLAAAALQVGAFPLPVASKDSALLYTVNEGAHTTGLLRPNSTQGIALIEIYDLNRTTESRLTNVSARMNVSTGSGALVAGLVIDGDVPKTVLIRGVGPTLSTFGVTGILADPQIAIYSGSTQVATNDNWEVGASPAATVVSTAAQVGAFALTAGSKDAAMVLTLQPGSYTVQVTGVGNTTGVALVEVYEVQ